MENENKEQTSLRVFVPVAGSRTDSHVTPGSGIVGQPRDEKIHLHYEGNLYGASNLHEINDRLRCAWGRLKDRYPTVAQVLVEKDDVIEVGMFDGQTIAFISGDTERIFREYEARYKAK